MDIVNKFQIYWTNIGKILSTAGFALVYFFPRPLPWSLMSIDFYQYVPARNSINQ